MNFITIKTCLLNNIQNFQQYLKLAKQALLEQTNIHVIDKMNKRICNGVDNMKMTGLVAEVTARKTLLLQHIESLQFACTFLV